MTNNDQKNTGMNISIHMTNPALGTQIYTLIEDIRTVTNEDAGLQMLKQYIIRGWSHTKDEVEQV